MRYSMIRNESISCSTWTSHPILNDFGGMR
jgi:hypothetical protein